MTLKLFNTLSQKIEIFKPLNPSKVGIYSCGPTVYNYAHIGNWRAYIFADLLRRYLLYKNYQVKQVMNITDVEDKIIKTLKKEDKNLKDLTEFYTQEFYKNRDQLNILPADFYPKATQYLKQMIQLIQILLEKGYAYQTKDKSIYFKIKKYKDYGKLSHFKISELKENAQGRLKKDEYQKENAQDFALWKSWTSEDGDVFWEPKALLGQETILGKGRPGWHIECSAMSMDLLGQSFDIHTGGVDNIFPHHENEIAQSECATGKMFAKYFIHNEHLVVNGQKMSKSSGNFYTLQDLIDKNFDPLAFRFWLLTSNYSTKTNFTFEAINGSQKALFKLRDFLISVDQEKKMKKGQINKKYKDLFIKALNNNLDSPKALALIWQIIKDPEILNQDKKATILDFDKVLGLNLDNFLKNLKEIEIPKKVKDLQNQRDQARLNKNWIESDKLREEIEDLGYFIQDTENSSQISKK
jgi:cysteinyl-tRNA synthetase